MNLGHWDEIKKYTEQRVRDPQTGDHFTEHFGSVALVTERCGKALWIAKPAKDRKGWGEPELMTLEAFQKWASYGTIPGYWLECIPGSGAAKQP